MLQFLQQLRYPAFTWACAFIGEAGCHGSDLACGKACRDEIADSSSPAQVRFAVTAITIVRALGIHEARALVMAQHALRDPEPFGGFLDLHLSIPFHIVLAP